MRLRAPTRVRRTEDYGFSLVEYIVALSIATAIFTALAFSLVGGTKAALLSQQNQQAGDALNQAVEDARALPYYSLVMSTTDLNTGEATRSPSLSSCNCYNPTNDTTGGTEVETLSASAAGGGLSPHVTSVAQNGGTYKLRRYVTQPVDATGAAYKRLTVIASWTSAGKARSRTYSTLISQAKRGLPLPDYKFTATSDLAICRNPGSTAFHAFAIRNNGARDTWRLTSNPSTPNWSFYADTNGNGAYDSPTDQPLAYDGGVPTTGTIEPTTSRAFFALRLLSGSPALIPTTSTTTFRAMSASQATYFQDLKTTLTVQDLPCAVSGTPTRCRYAGLVPPSVNAPQPVTSRLPWAGRRAPGPPARTGAASDRSQARNAAAPCTATRAITGSLSVRRSWG